MDFLKFRCNTGSC